MYYTVIKWLSLLFDSQVMVQSSVVGGYPRNSRYQILETNFQNKNV